MVRGTTTCPMRRRHCNGGFGKLARARGERLVDLQGRRIGKVTDNAFEANTFRPDWLVVKTRYSGGHGSCRSVGEAVEQSETIRVPFSKETVLDAPVPTIPTTPGVTEFAALELHYYRAA